MAQQTELWWQHLWTNSNTNVQVTHNTAIYMYRVASLCLGVMCVVRQQLPTDWVSNAYYLYLGIPVTWNTLQTLQNETYLNDEIMDMYCTWLANTRSLHHVSCSVLATILRPYANAKEQQQKFTAIATNLYSTTPATCYIMTVHHGCGAIPRTPIHYTTCCLLH